MGVSTGIEWCDATFNPWWGCRKISPACDHCYAEAFAAWIAPGLWESPNRRTFSDAHWRQPLRWARKLPAKLGRRPRVFSASMADVFDKEAPDGARDRLWALIRATPELDWLLLTKRIGNVLAMLPEDWGDGYANVWLGATVVTQAELERDGPKLHRVPARVRFYSMEPLLESVDLNYAPPPDWIIVGGESGHHARPLAEQWCVEIARYCEERGVPMFMKQGSEANWPHWKEFDRWRDELRVRQHPRARAA